MKSRSTCFILAILIAVGLPPTDGRSAEAKDHYLDVIKPVLRERCYACHGALKQKKDLRLDTARQIIDAGIIESGELLARLTSSHLDERMPPEGEPLHSEEIEAIRDWIDGGTPAPADELPEDDPAAHWAFQRIARPALPIGGTEKHPVDAFLEAKHDELGLQTQPEAERSLLIRRLYLDLVGLPPTRAQLVSTASFDSIVRDLLASPHHGERWGRHWMDIWRYADWYGLGKQLRNSQKHLWHWRDWIVESLNADKGYDRMILEMIAGDELEPENHEVLAATGYLARNYYLFNRTTWLDDTIEHTSKAFLGLTMNCAKCHNHKYDPIDQTDYYRFRAIFEPHQVRLDAIAGETDFEKDGLPRVFDDHPEAETFLHIRGNPATPDAETIIDPGVPLILAGFAPKPEPVELPPYAWAPGTRRYVQRDQLAAARAKLKSAHKALTIAEQTAESLDERASAPVIAENTGSSLKDDFDSERPELWDIVGTGWSYNGGILIQTIPSRYKQFVRSRMAHPRDFDLTVDFRTTGGTTYKSVGIRFDVADDGRNSHTVYASAHAPGPKVQISHTRESKTSYPAAGMVSRPVEVDEDYELRVQVRESLVNVSLNGEFLIAYNLPNRNPGGLIELFAFDATAEFDSIEIEPLAGAVELVKSGASPGKPQSSDPAADLKLAEARLEEAETGFRSLEARIAADNAAILGAGACDPARAARLEREHAVALARIGVLTAEAGKLEAAEKALEDTEAALEKTDANYASIRGSFKSPETPEHNESQYAATYAKTSTGRRLALARWMTSRENPLTARVAVNHVWLRHFGAPLVETVFDFGRRAPRPEHAELLDYLAVEFIESGWSMKRLHEMIVTSKAWRRSSSNLGADPGTRAIDPDNHFYWRMNSRRMESQVIRDSLLHLAGALDLKQGGPSVDPKAAERRRSLYLGHSRDQQDQLLSMFDDADIFACYRRSESIVPQQALALSNSEISIEMSEEVAALSAAEKHDREFASRVFELILCRKPDAAELDACATFLVELEEVSPEGPGRARLVHALFNHNDFINIR